MRYQAQGGRLLPLTREVMRTSPRPELGAPASGELTTGAGSNTSTAPAVMAARGSTPTQVGTHELPPCMLDCGLTRQRVWQQLKQIMNRRRAGIMHEIHPHAPSATADGRDNLRTIGIGNQSSVNARDQVTGGDRGVRRLMPQERSRLAATSALSAPRQSKIKILVRLIVVRLLLWSRQVQRWHRHADAPHRRNLRSS